MIRKLKDIINNGRYIPADLESLNFIPEDECCLVGTYSPSGDISPDNLIVKFINLMSKISTDFFKHQDDRALSYYFSVEGGAGEQVKPHVHFLLFKFSIYREAANPQELADKLARVMSAAANVKIEPYIINGNWKHYMTKEILPEKKFPDKKPSLGYFSAGLIRQIKRAKKY